MMMKFNIRKLLPILGLMLVMFSNVAKAQVTFKAEAPKVVAVGEVFNLTITANTSMSDFQEPDFNGFDEFGHLSTESTNIINGKSTYTQGVVFSLRAKAEGKYTIGSASMTANGQTYHTTPITIEVVKGQPQQQKQQQQQQQSGGMSSFWDDFDFDDEPVQPAPTGKDVSNDIFIRVIPTKTSLYRGDNFGITIKVYTNPQLNLAGYSNMRFPTFDGFWSKEIEMPQNVQWQRENVNGKIYNAGVLKRYTLFPQKAGDLKIDPTEITWIIQKVTGRRSMFFNDVEEVEKLTKSPAITIHVKDLPSDAPASFTGAVGQFTMNASLSRDKVTANDAISLNIRINGRGNLNLIGAPKVNFPHDFEVYESKKKDNIKNSDGSIEYEYPIIPRSAGTFNIPPIDFTYFDPSSGKYVTLHSNEFNIEVEKDPNGGQQATSITGVQQHDVKVLGNDIHYIKSQPQSWRKIGAKIFNFKNYYPFYIGLIVLFLIALFVLKRQNNLSQNISLMRTRKANSIARKRLKTAEKLMKLNSASGFYEELLRAVWGYVGDKFSVPVAELSRDNVSELFTQKGVEQADIDKFVSVVDECEFARYAPGASSTQMHSVYNNAIEIISKLEQKSK